MRDATDYRAMVLLREINNNWEDHVIADCLREILDSDYIWWKVQFDSEYRMELRWECEKHLQMYYDSEEVVSLCKDVLYHSAIWM
jgi:hypothetical protein